MYFNLDTNKYEEIKLKLSDEEVQGDLQEVIQEFCFGMASFFVDFALKINCNTEQAKGLQKVCIPCIDDCIEAILENGVLDSSEGQSTDEDMNIKEINELIDKLHAADYSEDEINNIVQLVKSLGSIEAANDYLEEIGKSYGIDFD